MDDQTASTSNSNGFLPELSPQAPFGFSGIPNYPMAMTSSSPFRQANGSQLQRVLDSCSVARGPRNSTQMNSWMDPYGMTSTTSSSRAGSVMSNVGSLQSMVSTGSCAVSIMSISPSVLSVNTQMSNFCQQYQRQDTSIVGDNQPRELGILTNDAAYQIIETLKVDQHTHGHEHRKAINRIFVYKYDSLTHVHVNYLKELLMVLFKRANCYALLTEETATEVLSALSMIIGRPSGRKLSDEIVVGSEGRSIHIICGWMAIGKAKEYNSAKFKKNLLKLIYFMIVRNETEYKRLFLKYAMETPAPPGMKIKEPQWLFHMLIWDLIYEDDPSHQVKPFACHLIRMFIGRNAKLMSYFAIDRDGTEKALNILDQKNAFVHSDEETMLQASKLIYRILETPPQYQRRGHPYTELFVSRAGVDRMADLLSHGSHRLILKCLECMLLASNVERLRTHNISPTILKVMQLLGCDNAFIVNRVVQFLSNISADPHLMGIAHNNKRVMVNAGAVQSLLQLLTSPQQYFESEHNINVSEAYESIRDHSLFCLYHLTTEDNHEKENMGHDSGEKTSMTAATALKQISTQPTLNIIQSIFTPKTDPSTGAPVEKTIPTALAVILYARILARHHSADPEKMRQGVAKTLSTVANPIYLVSRLLESPNQPRDAPQMTFDLLNLTAEIARSNNFEAQTMTRQWMQTGGHTFLTNLICHHRQFANVAQTIANLCGMPLTNTFNYQ